MNPSPRKSETPEPRVVTLAEYRERKPAPPQPRAVLFRRLAEELRALPTLTNPTVPFADLDGDGNA